MFPYEFRSRSVLNCSAACAGFPAERTATEFIQGAIVSVLFDEAQLQIADEAQRLLTAHYSGERLKTYLLGRGTFDRELWALFGAQGWTAICYPEAFGGLDLGLLELGLVAEACGAAVTGVAALTSSFALGQALLRFGADEQQNHWLPQLAAGSAIGAIFGALAFRTIGDLLFVFDFDPLWQPLFQGVILLLAVSLGAFALFRVRNRLEWFL